jgi:hypothetical protein
MPLRYVFGAALAALVLARPAEGQQVHAEVTAQAVPAFFHADPVAGGGTRSEIKLVQPVVMAHVGLPHRLSLLGTLDFEGLTMPGGELAPGSWGEGFVDRRHPHTYVHELLLSGDDLLRGVDGPGDLSLTIGKGFAPFGTDDPMSRPLLRYPVNHHLAQILERTVGIAAYRAGPVTVEAALFNGDEPERPGQWPNISRFGDSWSGRLTLAPAPGLELQGSLARVASPEHRPGSGTPQRKYSLSGRLERRIHALPVYGLVEWERTSEAGGSVRLNSFLAETEVRPGANRLAYRFERTSRPEEIRAFDPFRTERPHLENNILAITRWTVHTISFAREMGPIAQRLRVTPFLELSAGRITRIKGVIFDPASFYGGTHFWALTLGARIGLGGTMPRMGRYGAAMPSSPAMEQLEMHMDMQEQKGAM